jgi:hypothetical protein
MEAVMAEGQGGRRPGGQQQGGQQGGKGLDKEHTATNPETGATETFTQSQWKDKAFRQDLESRGFQRPEDLPEEGEEGGEGEGGEAQQEG